MYLIECPWCGVRDQAEFNYRGDASVSRPGPVADAEAFFEFAYMRDNRMGWQLEWWHHASGCRQWVKVLRNTVTHEIAATGGPDDKLQVPGR